jgi:hypothetical protein
MRSRLPALLLLALGAGAPASASYIDHEKKEINLKVVYFGPGGAGPKQNLEYVRSKSNPATHSELRRVGEGQEQILFFDFIPAGMGEIRGFKVRFHLYATTAPAGNEAVNRSLLRGADAVIFVADARASKAVNVTSKKQLDGLLEKAGLAPGSFQWVLQADRGKADAKVLTAAELAKALGLGEAPAIDAASEEGQGVFDTLKAAAKAVLMAMREEANRTADAAAAPKAAPSGPRVQGKGYSVPLPEGFSELRHPSVAAVWDAGGVVLRARKRIDAEQAFIGSVVITAVSTPVGDPAKDEAACAEIGSQVAAGTGAKLVKADVTDTNGTRTCRYALQDVKNPNRVAVGIVKTGPAWWVLTCNLDARDSDSASACAEVDGGFQFAAR